MKIVIVGGTGLIGRNTAPVLEKEGHEVVIASPSRGVNAVTGEGLSTAFKGADVVCLNFYFLIIFSPSTSYSYFILLVVC